MSEGAWIAAVAAGLNLTAFALMGVDKGLAKAGRRRIPERTLQVWALVGGWIGSWAGVFAFRHKTQKTAFLVPLGLATLINLAAVGWWLFG